MVSVIRIVLLVVLLNVQLLDTETYTHVSGSVYRVSDVAVLLALPMLTYPGFQYLTESPTKYHYML